MRDVVVAAAATGMGGLGGLLLGLGAVVEDIDAFAGSGSAGFSALGVGADWEVVLEDFGNDSGVFVVLGFAIMSTGFPSTSGQRVVRHNLGAQKDKNENETK